MTNQPDIQDKIHSASVKIIRIATAANAMRELMPERLSKFRAMLLKIALGKEFLSALIHLKNVLDE